MKFVPFKAWTCSLFLITKLHHDHCLETGEIKVHLTFEHRNHCHLFPLKVYQAIIEEN